MAAIPIRSRSISFPVVLLAVLCASAPPAAAREVAPTSTTAIIPFGPIETAPTLPARPMADFVKSNPKFRTLAKAIAAAGLTATLNKATDITLFAPDDQAFAAVPKAKLAALMKDPAKLKALLLHHVAKGRIDAITLLQTSPTMNALDGKPLRFVKKSGVKYSRVDGSVMIGSNMEASNGYMHVLNDVIWPGVVTPRSPGPPTSGTTVARSS